MTLLPLAWNPPVSWGTRSQVGAAIGALDDLRSQGGNQDGMWSNEDRLGGMPSGASNPLAAKFERFAAVGGSPTDEVTRLRAFRAAKEKEWGAPITSLEVSGRLPHADLFAATKAIALEEDGTGKKLFPAD